MFLIALALMQQIRTTERPAVQPKTGQFLVATANSRDPDLGHSVVLIIHSDYDGVMGLILNQPRGKAGYFGGPVALGVRILFRSEGNPGDAERILPGVFLTSNPGKKDARVYAGYVGWSPRQLSDEISRGLWKLIPGRAALVFDPNPETLWLRLAR